MAENYKVGFSLFLMTEWERVLPQAYIIECNTEGQMLYYRALAKPDLLEGYNIRQISPALEKALALTEELSPKNIELYFNKNKSKKVAVKSLFLDKDQKKLFSRYIDKRMDQLLQICEEHQLDICWNLERKVRFEEVRLAFLPFRAKAVLYFDKTMKGVLYTLKLSVADEMHKPVDLSATLINEEPAWLTVGQKLIRVEDINGVRFKPFLKKDSLFIPETLSKDFFEKFVVENLHLAQIETTGFDFTTEEEITKVQLNLKESFFDKRLVLDMVFYYQKQKFSHWEKTPYRNKLIINEQGDISVTHIKRDFAKESRFCDILLQCGFNMDESRHFYVNEDFFGVVHHLGKKQKQLNGFDISDISIDNKKILISDVTWNFGSRLENDWFDVYGTCVVGDYEIPVIKLFPFIKNKNPYFPLDNGLFFIIPEEMMASLAEIVLFGQWDGQRFLLHKSHHTLLENENPDINDSVKDTKLLSPDEVVYEPGAHLKGTLRPYQKHGVKWMLSHRMNGLGCLLADDMGLGKTLQVIALLAHVKESFKNESKETVSAGRQLNLFADERIYQPLKALVILPASLVFNWYQELTRFAPFLFTYVYAGANRNKPGVTLSAFDVILTTYKTAVLDIEKLSTFRFEYIILDESQTIKNKDSQTFKHLNRIQANHKISMSGTPVENSLRELWAQMQFINPDILGSFSFFENNFLKPIQQNNDEEKKAKLKNMIAPYLLRRTKYQVAPELPQLTRQIHYAEMDVLQQKLFEKEKSAIRNAILDENGKVKVNKMMVLVSLLRLRQIANHPVLVDKHYNGSSGKMEDVKNELNILCGAGHKVLVFSAFKSVLHLLASWSEEENLPFVILTGDQSSEERQKSVLQFQEDPNVKIFFISLKAGGVGLNLTAADYIFILDPWWNPFIEYQAEARAHRIGQSRPVFVKKFISKGSIEEKILILQEKKKNLAEEIISESQDFELPEEDLRMLLE
ncbi:MAG: DEAD/DEAH box helicase family protein [Saprospiraceae bacterium]|nr:DEAD/DEAH box helicase family protein [Saprospiraceae bacterium]